MLWKDVTKSLIAKLKLGKSKKDQAIGRKIMNISNLNRDEALKDEFDHEFHVYLEKYKKWKKMKEEYMNKSNSLGYVSSKVISFTSSPSNRSVINEINNRPTFIFLPSRSKMEQIIIERAKKS